MPKESFGSRRSEKAISLIKELRAQIQAGRSSGFNRTFLGTIDAHPELTIRECWERVESFLAQENQVNPRVYPFKFED